MIVISGVVSKRSEVFTQLDLVKLDCNKCGTTLGPYLHNSYSELKIGSCPMCESRGPFKVNIKQTIYKNYQKLTLQESPGVVPAARLPRYKEVILLNDMIDCACPGEEIEVTGIYTNSFELSLYKENGFPVFATMMEANHVSKKQVRFSAYKLTQEDKEDIQNLAKDPNIGKKIINSIAPSIYGHEDIKTAIALAMFGGFEKTAAGGHRLRGDINVLLLGDPGTAKSQLLKYVEKTGQKVVYTAGKGASGVGLTAAVLKDPVSHNWTLNAGALVLADRGICLVDELDKMDDRDRDRVDPVKDEMLATFVVNSHFKAQPKGGNMHRERLKGINRDWDEADDSMDIDENVEPSDVAADPEILPQSLLKKYITFAKFNVFPSLLSIDQDKLANFYAELRGETSSRKGVLLGVRHVESLIRMSEAHARMHLRHHVSEVDVDMAIRVCFDSFISTQQFGMQKHLQKKFKKYTDKKDYNMLILHILRKLVEDADTDPNLTHVEIKVKTLLSKVEDYDITDLGPFFSSTLFLSGGFKFDRDRYRVRCRLTRDGSGI